MSQPLGNVRIGLYQKCKGALKGLLLQHIFTTTFYRDLKVYDPSIGKRRDLRDDNTHKEIIDWEHPDTEFNIEKRGTK